MQGKSTRPCSVCPCTDGPARVIQVSSQCVPLHWDMQKGKQSNADLPCPPEERGSAGAKQAL
eukprot:1124639-Prorocentrum_lima.AAC.1